jgi:hypothetical protein
MSVRCHHQAIHWRREKNSQVRVLNLKVLITRLCLLGLIFCLLLVCGGTQSLYAAATTKTISGQAVLTEGVEKARKESISDALGEVLRNYIYGDMAVDHKFAPQIDKIILKNRNFYIKKFEIKSERTLGELYQIELRVELKSELIESELEKIEHLKKRQIKTLQVVVLPPEAVVGGSSDLENSDRSDALLTPVLEPTLLTRDLQQDLSVYGFTLTGSDPLRSELEATLVKLMETDNSYNLSRRQELDYSRLRGVISVDLLLVIRPSGVREERIASLNKSFWHSQADIVFIDMKNNVMMHLPTAESKVIGADYITGMERLTRELDANVRKSVLDRLLRDYVVPGGKEAQIILKCVGFRQPADFIVFKDRLKSVKTTKSVTLKELAAGSLEIEITTLSSIELLVKWINNFSFTGLSYRLSATALPASAAKIENRSAIDPTVVSPAIYLVEVIYGAPNGI